MQYLNAQIVMVFGLFLVLSCGFNDPDKEETKPDANFEKSEILDCLNNETKAAFDRNYELWTKHWVHRDDISKTYINFVDSSFSESIGWTNISDFVKQFIEEHPDPEPTPKLLDDINVQLYDNGAWVSYELLDSLRGLKRETRLMEKEDGKWKIAGMHTTIYGFEDQ